MARLAPEVSGTEGDHTVHTSIDFFKRLIRYDSIGSLKNFTRFPKKGNVAKKNSFSCLLFVADVLLQRDLNIFIKILSMKLLTDYRKYLISFT